MKRIVKNLMIDAFIEEKIDEIISGGMEDFYESVLRHGWKGLEFMKGQEVYEQIEEYGLQDSILYKLKRDVKKADPSEECILKLNFDD